MNTHILISVYLVLSVADAQDDKYPWSTKQYRSDYEYNKKTDSFYKLHIESRREPDLNEVCRVEGAELMSPHSDDDIIQLHVMFKKFPDLGEYVWVAEDGKNHESAEEQPLIDLNTDNEITRTDNFSNCDVVTRDGDIETLPCFRQLPFICKVTAREAPYDPHCQVFAQGYKYFPSVGSCYKMPRIAYTWSEAYTECEAEGAHLVVLNSETEREIVQNITLTEAAVPKSTTSYFFLAGFRSLMPPAPREFKTIFNQTLRQAGFSEWSVNEPNNANGREYCGTIFKNDGKLNDVECSHKYAFICEKEIKKI